MRIASPFAPNDRDLTLIGLVFEHRYLSTDLAAALLVEPPGEGRQYGFSLSALRARCNKLRTHGYLTWQHMSDLPSGRGKHTPRPAVYSIGPKAVDLLAELYGKEREELKKTLKLNQVGSHFLRHFLGVARFRVCLTLACAQTAGRVHLASWLQGGTLKDSVTVVTDGEEESVPVVPDAFFSLDVAGRGKAHFALGFDRGTMPLADIRRKALGYWHYYRTKRYQRKYFYANDGDGPSLHVVTARWHTIIPAHQRTIIDNAVRSFQVLFVARAVDRDRDAAGKGGAPLRERQGNLRRAVQSVTDIHQGTRRFFFATEDVDYGLEQPTTVLAPIWQTARPNDAHRYTLLD